MWLKWTLEGGTHTQTRWGREEYHLHFLQSLLFFFLSREPGWERKDDIVTWDWRVAERGGGNSRREGRSPQSLTRERKRESSCVKCPWIRRKVAYRLCAHISTQWQLIDRSGTSGQNSEVSVHVLPFEAQRWKYEPPGILFAVGTRAVMQGGLVVNDVSRQLSGPVF
jgi:hypothetical protein